MSVQRAAEELHVTPSAISHQLRALETYLGIRLFHRHSRRIVLTDTGRTYLQSIGGIFDHIESATRDVVEGGISDVLTVHCPPTFAPAWLLPRVPDFMAKHPSIDLRIHATPEPPDFFRSDTDVEIRYGDGDWPGLISIELMPDRVAPLMSPGLRAKLPEALAPEHLKAVTLIHSERSPVSWADWFRHHGVPGNGRLRGPRFDRGYLSIQAAVDGIGVALESVVFADREVRSGTLITVFELIHEGMKLGGHYLVYPEIYRDIPKVAAFTRWIRWQAGGGDPSKRGDRSA